jgi:hypothetical protein
MTAKQSLYLTEDRSTVVLAGDPRAKFKLVNAGRELNEKRLGRHFEAASKLAGGKASKDEKPDEKHSAKK